MRSRTSDMFASKIPERVIPGRQCSGAHNILVQDVGITYMKSFHITRSRYKNYHIFVIHPVYCCTTYKCISCVYQRTNSINTKATGHAVMK